MKRFLVRLIIVVVLVLSAVIWWKYFYTYSEGYRAGLLQKFSHRGGIFKTYEGEMILSSVQSSSNVTIASEKFLFSVKNEAIAKRLEQMQGEHVIVHYEQKNSTLPWQGDSPYIVDSVKVKTNSQDLR
jgi:hypothetical protein